MHPGRQSARTPKPHEEVICSEQEDIVATEALLRSTMREVASDDGMKVE